VKSLSHVWLFATPWTVACQAPSSVHGIFQARILEWITISFSRAFLLSTLLLVTDCVGVAVEGQERFITTKHTTRGKIEDERQFQNRNNMNSHCTTNVGNSTRHFQTPALSFTPTPTWEWQQNQRWMPNWSGPFWSFCFPGGSDGRVYLQCGRPGFNPWVENIPWRRKW